MDEAFRGMKVLGSEMKLNTAVFGDNASSMEGLDQEGRDFRQTDLPAERDRRGIV